MTDGACAALHSDRDDAHCDGEPALCGDQHALAILGVRLPRRDRVGVRRGLCVRVRHAVRREGVPPARAERRRRAVPDDDAARRVLRARGDDDRVRHGARQGRARGRRDRQRGRLERATVCAADRVQGRVLDGLCARHAWCVCPICPRTRWSRC